MNLALTLEQAGKTDDAIRAYETALEVYPGHMPTVQALARLSVVQRREDLRLAGWLDEIAMRAPGNQRPYRDRIAGPSSSDNLCEGGGGQY